MPGITLNDLEVARTAVQISDDPTDALKMIEQYMDEIQTANLVKGWDETALYLVETVLPGIVLSLLNRGDLDDKYDATVFRFLEMTLSFTARHMSVRLDSLLLVANQILCECDRPFYSFSSCASNDEMDGDRSNDDDVSLSSAFEDCDLMCCAKFADASQAGMPYRGGVSQWIVNMVNVFGRNGGFKAIRDELMLTDPPLSKTRSLLRLIFEVKDVLTEEFLNWFAVILAPIIEQVLHMPDEDLKMDYKVVNEVSNYATALYQISSREDAQEMTDTLKLRFALKGFMSPFLERRVVGITDICALIDEVWTCDVRGAKGGEEMNERPWITQEFLCDWLTENDILTSVFQRNVHAEVLKRSGRLLAFLTANNMLGNNETKMIWEASRGKHESIQNTVLELLAGNMQYHQAASLRALLTHIERLKPIDYTIWHLILLKNITWYLISYWTKGMTEADAARAGLDLLWTLMQDDVSLANNDMHMMVTTFFNDCLEASGELNDLRIHFIGKCVQNLRDHQSVAVSLLVLYQQLRLPLGRGPDEKLLVDCIKDDEELIGILTEDMLQSNVDARLALKEAKETPGDIDQFAYTGLVSHTATQERRLVFLHGMMLTPGISLTRKHLDTIWRATVLDGWSERVRGYTFKWLEHLITNPSSRNAALATCEYVFVDFVCMLDAATFCDSALSLLQVFMNLLSSREPWPIPNPPSLENLAMYEAKGTQKLWEIATAADSEVVASQAREILNRLYRDAATGKEVRGQNKAEEYIANCMQRLQVAAEGKSPHSDKLAKRCIRLLTAFLHNAEREVCATGAECPTEKHWNQIRRVPVEVQVQVMGLAGPLPVVRFYSNTSLHQVWHRVCGVVGLDPMSSSVRMFTKAGELCLRDGPLTVAEAKICTGDILHVQVNRERGAADNASAVRREPSVLGAEGDNSVVKAGSNQSLASRSPHEVLCNSYFGKLTDLLSSSSPMIAWQVWELLMVLPTNRRVLEELKGLGMGWDEVLSDEQSMYMLWYGLQVCEKLLEEEEPKKREGGGGNGGNAVGGGEGGWRRKFVASGGLDRLILLVMSDRFAEASDCVATTSCLSLLLKVILDMVHGGADSQAFGDLTRASSLESGVEAVGGVGVIGVMHEDVAVLESLCSSQERFDDLIYRLLRIVHSSASAVGEAGDKAECSNRLLDASRHGVAQHSVQLLASFSALRPEALGRVYSYDSPSASGWVADAVLRCRRPELRQDIAKGILAISTPRGASLQERAAKRRRTSGEEGLGARSSCGSITDGLGRDDHPLIFFLRIVLELASEVQAAAVPGGGWGGGGQGISELFSLVGDMLRCAFEEGGDVAREIELGLRRELTDAATLMVGTLRRRRGAEIADMEGVEERSELFDEVDWQRGRSGTRKDSGLVDGDAERVVLGNMTTLRLLVKLCPRLATELCTDEVAGSNTVGSCADSDMTDERPGSPAPSTSGMRGFVDFLHDECLFSAHDAPATRPPMCTEHATRQAAFDLVLELVSLCPRALSNTLSKALRLHSRRESRELPSYQPSALQKSPTGFVGLRNLGATCYMNSLMQQLFHTPAFRAEALCVPITEVADSQEGELMYQLQLLFGHLMSSELRFYETKNFCAAFRGSDGEPINTSLQMDVDEFFNILFERLEKAVKGTSHEKMLQQCFGGKLVNQIICKEEVKVGDKFYGGDEPFKSERSEMFYTLPLAIKHKRTIKESLDLFVEGEVLEGDNKYYCEEGNCRVDVVKRTCILELPPVLILNLKRFEFDFDFMKKVKINDCCQFPLVLDMDPYTLDGIERREKAAADAVKEGRDRAKAVEQVVSPDGSAYGLVGVLVHTGTADSGHYYSYVKDRGGEGRPGGGWFLFNDTLVDDFDQMELGMACFGGTDVVPHPGGGQRAEYIPRMHNAYMLFYERIQLEAPPSASEAGKTQTEQQQQQEQQECCRTVVPQAILDIVTRENLAFARDKYMFDQSYFSYLERLVVQGLAIWGEREQGRVYVAADCASGATAVKAAGCCGRKELDEMMEISIRFVMDVLSHSWDSSKALHWMRTVRSMLTEDEAGLSRSQWIVREFISDPTTLRTEMSDSRTDIISDSTTASHAAGGEQPAGQWLRWGLLLCREPGVREQVAETLVRAVSLLSSDHHHQQQRKPSSTSPTLSSSPPDRHLPHCLPMRGESRGTQEHTEAFSGQPLLTDDPWPRRYPGGLDDSKDFPLNYLPFPRPTTSVGTLIDHVLDLLPDVTSLWRHHHEYFKLLHDIARLGPSEAIFLLSRRAISRCIDIFLHDESPFACTRLRAASSDICFSASFDSLFSLLSYLITCSDLPTDSGPSDPSPWRPGSTSSPSALQFQLDEACLAMLSSPNFPAQIISVQGAMSHAALDLVLHLCWRDMSRTNSVLVALVDAVGDSTADEAALLFPAAAQICGIADGLQLERCERFIELIACACAEPEGHPETITAYLSLASSLCSSVPCVRAGMAQLFTEEWGEGLLTHPECRTVRSAAAHCVEVSYSSSSSSIEEDGELNPGLAMMESLASIVTRAVGGSVSEPDAGEDIMLSGVLQALSGLMSRANLSKGGQQEQQQQQQSRLWSPVLQRIVSPLLVLLARADGPTPDPILSGDQAELLCALYNLANYYPEAFVGPSAGEANGEGGSGGGGGGMVLTDEACMKLLSCRLHLQKGNEAQGFNPNVATFYYKLILCLTIASPSFAACTSRHPAIVWALEHLALGTDTYTDASLLIIDLVTHVVKYDGGLLRKAAFDLLSKEGGAFATSPANSAILTARLLLTEGSRADAIRALSCPHILSMLLSLGGLGQHDDMGMPPRQADMAKKDKARKTLLLRRPLGGWKHHTEFAHFLLIPAVMRVQSAVEALVIMFKAAKQEDALLSAADELAKVPKSGKAMAVAGIFERLSGGNSETANRLDMLLLLDALTGLDQSCMQACIIQTMHCFNSATTLTPGGCTHHAPLPPECPYDALWPAIRGSREANNLADAEFFRLLSTICTRMLEFNKQQKDNTRVSGQAWKILIFSAMTAMTGPGGCPQTFAKMLSSLPPKPPAAPLDAMGAEWISRVLAPPFHELLKYPEVAGAVPIVASRSTKTAIDAVCEGLVQHIHAVADQVVRGVPYDVNNKSLEAAATRLCMFARSLRVVSTSPGMLEAFIVADEGSDESGCSRALGVAFEATGAREETAGLGQLVVGFEANIQKYAEAVIAAKQESSSG